MKGLPEIEMERILFSPLNWGWGHVARSIPMLKMLEEQNNIIFIACSKKQREVYKEYLSSVEYLDGQDYPFGFGGKGNFVLDVLKSFRKLYIFGLKEKKWVKFQVQSLDISMVLSDHRYLFRSKKVKSIFITHQLNLPVPWYLIMAQWVHQYFVLKFDGIWVVDDPKINLAGKLSTISNWNKKKAQYIGLLSRFKNKTRIQNPTLKTTLVSGPSVYAAQFFEDQKKEQGDASILLFNRKIHIGPKICSATWKEMDEVLLKTKVLIAPSGYSTLMDAYFLECKTHWHPTPGQREQEYLAQHNNSLA